MTLFFLTAPVQYIALWNAYSVQITVEIQGGDLVFGREMLNCQLLFQSIYKLCQLTTAHWELLLYKNSTSCSMVLQMWVTHWMWYIHNTYEACMKCKKELWRGSPWVEKRIRLYLSMSYKCRYCSLTPKCTTHFYINLFTSIEYIHGIFKSRPRNWCAHTHEQYASKPWFSQVVKCTL